MTIQANSYSPDVYLVSSIAVDDKFNITFPFNEDDENIAVFVRKPDNSTEDLVLDTDYFVIVEDGTNNVFGTIRIRVAHSGLMKLCIKRNIPISQENAFDNELSFADTAEKSLDKLTMIAQDNQFKNYTIHVPDDEDVTASDLELPPVSKRANQPLYFDSQGKVAVGDIEATTKSLRQSRGEVPDDSFEMMYQVRLNKLLGFDNKGSVNLMNYYSGGDHITIDENNVISTTGLATPYSAGDNISISDKNVISVTGLADVATSGSYNDLSDKLTAGDNISISDKNAISVTGLADVATSGSYNDLSDKLTAGKNISISDKNVISSQSDPQIQADYTQTDTTKVDYIKNKPALAAVATSGSYNDLSDQLQAGEGIHIGNNIISLKEIPVAELVCDVNTSGFPRSVNVSDIKKTDGVLLSVSENSVFISNDEGRNWSLEQTFDNCKSLAVQNRNAYALDTSHKYIWGKMYASQKGEWSVSTNNKVGETLGFTVSGIVAKEDGDRLFAYGGKSLAWEVPLAFTPVWTIVDPIFAREIVKIEYVNNVFVAIGFDGDTSATFAPLAVRFSTDGLSWSSSFQIASRDPGSIGDIKIIGNGTDKIIVYIKGLFNFSYQIELFSGTTPSEMTRKNIDTDFGGIYIGFAFDYWWATKANDPLLYYTTDFVSFKSDDFSLPAQATCGYFDGTTLVLTLADTTSSAIMHYKKGQSRPIIAGNGLDFNNGVLSLETATPSNLGGIIVGDGLTADSNGNVTVNIVDALDSESTIDALSANMGKALNDAKQDKLTAGDNITISDNVISATSQIQADYTQTDTSKLDYIKNKPTLATVATSGSYNDLSNKLTAGDNITISNNVISANIPSNTFIFKSPHVNMNSTLVYINGVYVTGSWRADGRYSYSTDGCKTWTDIPGLGNYASNVTLFNGIMMNCNENDKPGKLQYSTDGIKYTIVDVPRRVIGMAYKNGIYACAAPSEVYYSTDYTQWENYSVDGTGRPLTAFMALGPEGSGMFIATSSYGTAVSSSDCVEWHQWNVPYISGTGIPGRLICYMNGMYLVADNTPENKCIRASENGYTFSSAYSYFDLQQLAYLKATSSLCIGIPKTGDTIIYSVDGNTWNRIVLPITWTYDIKLAINEDNGMFLAMLKDSTTGLYRFFYTFDGENWREASCTWPIAEADEPMWAHDRWYARARLLAKDGHTAGWYGITFNFLEDWIKPLI